MSKPQVKRSGRRLTCVRGRWQNATHYAYAWLIRGHIRHGASTSTLTVTHALKGRAIACRVTASNAAGTATATSRAVVVR